MKTVCLYCHGETNDDERGNCAGCGAPRLEHRKPLFAPGQTASAATAVFIARPGISFDRFRKYIYNKRSGIGLEPIGSHDTDPFDSTEIDDSDTPPLGKVWR